MSEAIILGTMLTGHALAFAPSYKKASAAAARIFAFVDRKPKIDGTGEAGLRLAS